MGGQLAYDPHTGFITAYGGSLCMTARECPSSLPAPQRGRPAESLGQRDSCPAPGESLCLMKCVKSREGAGGSRQANQVWHWDEKHSIRLRADSSLCLTSTNYEVLSQIKLVSCTGPDRNQQWIALGTPFAMYVGICARLSTPSYSTKARHQSRRGYCLNVGWDAFRRGFWQLERNGTVILARGSITSPVESWHTLVLRTQGASITASVDDDAPVTVADTAYVKGMVAVNSGWGEVYVDNFAIRPASKEKK